MCSWYLAVRRLAERPGCDGKRLSCRSEWSWILDTSGLELQRFHQILRPPPPRGHPRLTPDPPSLHTHTHRKSLLQVDHTWRRHPRGLKLLKPAFSLTPSRGRPLWSLIQLGLLSWPLTSVNSVLMSFCSVATFRSDWLKQEVYFGPVRGRG